MGSRRVASLSDSSSLRARGEGWPPDMVAGNTPACLGPQGAGSSGSSMEGRRQSRSRKEGEERRREWEAGVSQRLRTRVVEKHSQQFPMEKARLLPGLQAGPWSLPDLRLTGPPGPALEEVP